MMLGRGQTVRRQRATDRDHDDSGVGETHDERRRLRLMVVLGLLVARKDDEHDEEGRQELDAKRLAF